MNKWIKPVTKYCQSTRPHHRRLPSVRRPHTDILELKSVGYRGDINIIGNRLKGQSSGSTNYCNVATYGVSEQLANKS